MLRRSLCIMNKAGSGGKRTVVRDPRRQKSRSSPAVVTPDDTHLPAQQQQPQQQMKNPFPLQPVQGGLGSFVLMGAGMSIGFALVGALFGGF